MKKYNKLITFEGIDGSGKTTIINMISEYLLERGIDNFVTREPGGKNLKISEEIRNLIMNNSEIDPLTELLLFEASRREHYLKIIKKNIEVDKIVLCDRFIDSSLVYQGSKGVEEKYINFLNKIVIDENFPGITFLFDLDPEIALKRISTNNRNQNRFDQEDLIFFNSVREKYLKIYKNNKNRIYLINADDDVKNIFINVLKIIEKELKIKYEN